MFENYVEYRRIYHPTDTRKFVHKIKVFFAFHNKSVFKRYGARNKHNNLIRT